MTRPQWFVLCIAALNLLLVLLFPPHDYVGLQHGNVPTFDGFHYVFSDPPNRVLNEDFLALQIIVVLLNACLAWLLLRPRPVGKKRFGGNRYQRAVLWLVAANLVLVVLFPPFQNYAAITQAALPSFEGFYFLFADNSTRQIVATILYLEVMLILVNGGLLWLLLKDRGPEEKLSAEDVRALAQKLRPKG